MYSIARQSLAVKFNFGERCVKFLAADCQNQVSLVYSARSASIADSRMAFTAGYSPKQMPSVVSKQRSLFMRSAFIPTEMLSRKRISFLQTLTRVDLLGFRRTVSETTYTIRYGVE